MRISFKTKRKLAHMGANFNTWAFPFDLAYKNKMHRVKPDSQQPPVLRKNSVSKGQKNQRDFFIWSIIKNISAMTGEECPKYIHGKCNKPTYCLGDAHDKHY